MHINLSKEFVGFIDQNVESGFYTNAAEVVR
ncbi:MAG: putative addiction module CopG family antidote, partial [Rickettsiales bacterium]